MTDTGARLTDLQADPFTALSVHFGMLLGVSDIDLLAANARGKLRLHNAWLHGAGVVHGFRVSFRAESRELRVDPGLALDALGRELHLGVTMCLNLDDWFAKHHKDVEDLPHSADAFDVDVVVRFLACLDRPVPALAGECDDSPESAYSRVQETVALSLEPVNPDAPAAEGDGPWHHLKAHLSSAAPGSLAHALAEDSLALRPLPEEDPGVVVARVHVRRHDDGVETTDAEINHDVRRVHVPTMVVHELLGLAVRGEPRLGDPHWSGDTKVSLASTAPLFENTLAGNVVAHTWDTAGGKWDALPIASAHFADGRLTVEFSNPVASHVPVRLVLVGSGPTPVVADVDGEPVALGGDVALTLKRN